jgi:hypothetical protein
MDAVCCSALLLSLTRSCSFSLISYFCVTCKYQCNKLNNNAS